MTGAPALGQYVRVRVLQKYPLCTCAHFLSFAHFCSGGRSKILKYSLKVRTVCSIFVSKGGVQLRACEGFSVLIFFISELCHDFLICWEKCVLTLIYQVSHANSFHNLVYSQGLIFLILRENA